MDFIDLKAQQNRIRQQIDANIKKVLDHGQYIMGPEIGELETVLSKYVNSKHCITNASGTDALLMALMALDVKPNDEVITTPFTFFATGEVISLLGAKPILVDIDPKTYTIDPRLIEEKITSKTKAIIPVSLYGLCPDLDQINSIAIKYNIPIIEDAAQSFGATYKGKKSCSLTTIGCTSFFPSKPLGGYGDSGACFTNDDDLAQRMREIRIHGQSSRYNHTRLGINGRMDTIQAAILLAKMEIFEEEVQRRGSIGSKYTELIDGRLKIQFIPKDQTNVFGQYTVEVPNRSEVQRRLNEQRIPTAVHYPVPIHLQPVYQNLGYKKGDFPNSEIASERVMSLPMHPYLKDTEQTKVINLLISSLD